MIVQKLATLPMNQIGEWRDPTIDEPADLVAGDRLGSAHGVILSLDDKVILRITQYRISDHNWGFQITQVYPDEAGNTYRAIANVETSK